jgi:hypothetical protein
MHLGAGAWVTAGGCLTLRYLEIAKADNPHRVSAAEGSLNVAECRFDGLLGRILRQFRILRHMGDQFCFVHGSPSFRSGPNLMALEAVGTLRFTDT